MTWRRYRVGRRGGGRPTGADRVCASCMERQPARAFQHPAPGRWWRNCAACRDVRPAAKPPTTVEMVRVRCQACGAVHMAPLGWGAPCAACVKRRSVA